MLIHCNVNILIIDSNLYNMIEVGQVISLNDNKEYIVVSKINLHNINYVYLMTNSKPLEIMIATEKLVNGDIVLDEVKNNEELDYVLSKLVLAKDKDDEID